MPQAQPLAALTLSSSSTAVYVSVKCPTLFAVNAHRLPVTAPNTMGECARRARVEAMAPRPTHPASVLR